MNAKQRLLVEDLVKWVNTVVEVNLKEGHSKEALSSTFNALADSPVFEWGSERMENAMLRAGYSGSMLIAVRNMTPEGCKLIDTIDRCFKNTTTYRGLKCYAEEILK